MTSKGNLVVEWHPTGYSSAKGLSKDTDWRNWMLMGAHLKIRPSNELLIIRGVEDILDLQAPIHWIDAHLLHACSAIIAQLKHRLERSYEITVLRDVFERWSDDHNEPTLLEWCIDEPNAHQEREDRQNLDNFEETFRISEAKFLEAWEAATYPRLASGKLPSDDTIQRRLSVSLAMLNTSSAMQLIERYRGRPSFLDNEAED